MKANMSDKKKVPFQRGPPLNSLCAREGHPGRRCIGTMAQREQ